MWRFLSACVVLGTVVLQAAAQTSLTEEDKQELLDVHNDLRGMVNPPARNMLRMVSCMCPIVATWSCHSLGPIAV